MSADINRAHWRPAVFGDLVRNVNEYFDAARDGALPYVAGPHIDAGMPRVSRYGSTEDDEFPPTFKRKFESGDVLLHSRGLEKTAVVDRPGVTGEKLFVLRSRDEALLDQRFLVWLMQSPGARRYMNRNLAGSVNKFLNWKPLAEMPLQLPPLEVQKRIADLLWAVDRHRVSVAALAEPLERCEDLLMEIRCDTSTTLGDVVSIARSGATPLRSNPHFYGGTIPWLKSGEVSGDGISESQESITDDGLAASATHLMPSGTVVVAMYGDGRTRGRVGRLGVPMATNQAVLGMVPDESKAHPDFFYYWLRSRQDQLRSKGAGAAQKNLSKAIILSEPFPACSLREQSTVAQRFARLEEALAESKSEVSALVQLLSSAVDWVFGDNE